jgi:hypothetical protein
MSKKIDEFIMSLQHITFGDAVWAGRGVTVLLIDVWAVVVLVGLLPSAPEQAAMPVMYYCAIVVALCFGMIGIIQSNPSARYIGPVFDLLESNLDSRAKETRVFA